MRLSEPATKLALVIERRFPRMGFQRGLFLILLISRWRR